MLRKDPSRSVSRGLARQEPRNNIIIAYAARDGTTAKDGSGRNSPFTRALLNHLTTPGLEIDLFFRKVRDEVISETDHEQQPFIYGYLSKEPIYLATLTPTGDGSTASTDAAPHDSVTECDRLAAAPRDEKKPPTISGVEMDKIDVLHALAACEIAMQAYPNVPRFYFETARIADSAKNYKLAAELYERAGSMGYSSAMSNLGALYFNGLGVEKNLELARAWFEKAADLDDTSAIVALGEIYQRGAGIAVDYEKARALFEKAATRGDSLAINNLGVIYLNGRGVTKNFAEARRLFERSAAQRDDLAMLNLGEMFERGYGVPIDLDKAKKWYGESAAAGNEEAKKRLRNLK
jgi:hypothetical protein